MRHGRHGRGTRLAHNFGCNYKCMRQVVGFKKSLFHLSMINKDSLDIRFHMLRNIKDARCGDRCAWQVFNAGVVAVFSGSAQEKRWRNGKSVNHKTWHGGRERLTQNSQRVSQARYMYAQSIRLDLALTRSLHAQNQNFPQKRHSFIAQNPRDPPSPPPIPEILDPPEQGYTPCNFGPEFWNRAKIGLVRG
jgi:hypothetical protein